MSGQHTETRVEFSREIVHGGFLWDLLAKDAPTPMAALVQEGKEETLAQEEKEGQGEGDEDADGTLALPPPPPVLRTQSSVQSIHEMSVQRLVIIM